MYAHLRIKNANPALAEATLNNLGQINVICGKNNSGKSATLRGIENVPIVGKSFDPELFREPRMLPTIWHPKGRGNQDSVPPNAVENISEVPNFWDRYFKTVESVLRNERIWFADQSFEFKSAVEKAAKNVRGKYLFENVRYGVRPAILTS